MLGEIILVEIDLVLILAGHSGLSVRDGLVSSNACLVSFGWRKSRIARALDLAASLKEVMLFSALDIVLVAALITLLYASFAQAALCAVSGSGLGWHLHRHPVQGGSNALWLVDTGYLTLQYLIIPAALALFMVIKVR